MYRMFSMFLEILHKCPTKYDITGHAGRNHLADLYKPPYDTVLRGEGLYAVREIYIRCHCQLNLDARALHHVPEDKKRVRPALHRGEYAG
jgi:hypothetical protein